MNDAERLTLLEERYAHLQRHVALQDKAMLELGEEVAKLRQELRVLRAQVTGGAPDSGVTTDERARMKAMEREIKELRQANEILRKASAYFAQAELDRRYKP